MIDPARTFVGTETDVTEETLKVTVSPSAKVTGDPGLLTYQLETVRSQVPEEPPFQIIFFATLSVSTVPVRPKSIPWPPLKTLVAEIRPDPVDPVPPHPMTRK